MLAALPDVIGGVIGSALGSRMLGERPAPAAQPAQAEQPPPPKEVVSSEAQNAPPAHQWTEEELSELRRFLYAQMWKENGYDPEKTEMQIKRDAAAFAWSEAKAKADAARAAAAEAGLPTAPEGSLPIGAAINDARLINGKQSTEMDFIVGDGTEYWRDPIHLDSFGIYVWDPATNTAAWRENSDVMKRANDAVARFRTEFGLVMGSAALAGVGGAGVAIIGGPSALGLTGWSAAGFDIVGAGGVNALSQPLFRSAVGEENTWETAGWDFVTGSGIAAAFKGAGLLLPRPGPTGLVPKPLSPNASAQELVFGSSSAERLQFNNAFGESFEQFVMETKLAPLDEAGLLGTKDDFLWPTPDLPGTKGVRPDFVLHNNAGDVAALADAKAGAIDFDDQAKGLILWARTTTNRTLIYYTPNGTTRISPNMFRYANQNGVKIRQIGVE